MYFCEQFLLKYMNHYEAVFILNPVLSDDQVKETVQKFEDLLKKKGAEIISTETWGLKKLAYSIQNKQSGFYNLLDFKASPSTIDFFEVELRRDERVMRYLNVKLDKHADAWSVKRRERNTKKL
jgi:small subunit ribosomal protein S6|tara:strand:+ start:252 stop:623 length:372 start_codon:yes stop_codon:yes gene_type:complete